MKVILISILILATSCKSQKKSIVETSNNDKLVLLVQDGYFFTDKIETDVIRDEKALKSFFSKVNKTRKPGIPVPKVDFSKEMILVACMGEQKTAAMPFLKMLEGSKQEQVIGIELKSKSKKTEQITSYPFCVYKMPTSTDKIIFRQL
jgi:hypothetical protein